MGKATRPPQPLAPRLDGLNGKTICGLFNGRYHFDETWPVVKQALSERFPGVKFVDWEPFGRFYGKEELTRLEELPAKLRQYGCDAVISGRGC